MNTTTKPRDLIHVFEAAGLGIAPFTFAGEVDNGKVTTTCDYCGTGIRYEEIIRDSKGKTFKVGCECVRKTADHHMISLMAEAEKSRKARQKAEAEAAKLQAQRDKNGGQTDGEIQAAKRADEEAQRQEALKAEKEAIRAESLKTNRAVFDLLMPWAISHQTWRQEQWNDLARTYGGAPRILPAGEYFDPSTFLGSVWEQLESKPLMSLSYRQREALTGAAVKGLKRVRKVRCLTKGAAIYKEVQAILLPEDSPGK